MDVFDPVAEQRSFDQVAAVLDTMTASELAAGLLDKILADYRTTAGRSPEVVICSRPVRRWLVSFWRRSAKRSLHELEVGADGEPLEHYDGVRLVVCDIAGYRLEVC